MIQQKELGAEGLTTLIKQLADNPAQLRKMADAARSVGLSQATDTVARHCLEVSGLEVSHG